MEHWTFEEDEDLMIMEERASRCVSLDEDALREPIARFCRTVAVIVPTTATLGYATRLMQETRSTALCVTRAGFLMGILTEQDVMRKVVGRLGDLHEHSVVDVMTPSPEVLQADDMILFLLNKMLVGGYRHIPVVDRFGRPEHMISLRDVVEELLMSSFEKPISNLPPDPVRGPSPRWGG